MTKSRLGNAHTPTEDHGNRPRKKGRGAGAGCHVWLSIVVLCQEKDEPPGYNQANIQSIMRCHGKCAEAIGRTSATVGFATIGPGGSDEEPST